MEFRYSKCEPLAYKSVQLIDLPPLTLKQIYIAYDAKTQKSVVFNGEVIYVCSYVSPTKLFDRFN
jgi:hypothetical protein